MPPKKVTRSSASKKQRQEISIASGSSPPKGTRTKKSIKLPEVTGITHQVVTVTKQAKSSKESSSDSNSNNGNSTENGNASITAITMTSVFDPKLEHLMTHYFMALGDQHDIRQALIQNQIIDFETFVGSCDMEFLRDMQLTKGGTTGDALNKAKLKLVNDVILYYEFMYQDKEYAKADNSTQWIKQGFKFWKS